MNDCIVVGGGVAGLVAALHLAERGLKPLLLEADPYWIGGRLRNGPAVEFEHGGRRWRFGGEHGIHGIWSGYVNLKAVLARHGITPDLLPSREETWIFGRGRTIRKAGIGSALHASPLPAPFHYLHFFLRPRFANILTVYDLLMLPRVLATLLYAMAIDPLAEHKAISRASLADLTAGWSPTLRSLFAGLARNAIAAHPEDVPASGFIAFLRFYTLLRRDAWAFAYMAGPGGAQIAEPLAEAARRLGARIQIGARVTSLEPSDSGWRVDYDDSASGQARSAEGQQVVLALDAPAAERLLRASPATAPEAAALRFPQGVPTAIIRAWFEGQPRPTGESGICTGDFCMDNFFWLHRLHPAYAEWSQATGGSALEMHIYGPPEVLARPDAALLAQVLLDAGRAFPELPRKPIHALLLRNEPTHTLFGVGEPGAHLGVTTPWDGLFACGDWVYHPLPALYLERATSTGIAAANAALERRGLAPWPLVEHPRPERLAGALAGALGRVRRRVLRRA